MRILITGGAGFIGCHLAERLLAQGDEVWALDDLSTGSIENIEHLRAHPACPMDRALTATVTATMAAAGEP